MWLNELKQNAEPECVILLIGNKIDLVERNPRRREVSYEEGKIFAKENGLHFMETSALSCYNVNEAFEELLQEAYNERRKVSNITKKRNTLRVKLNQTNKQKVYEKENCC